MPNERANMGMRPMPLTMRLLVLLAIGVVVTTIVLGSGRLVIGGIDGHPIDVANVHQGAVFWVTIAILWVLAIYLCRVAFRVWRKR
jgi:hypothetical protein